MEPMGSYTVTRLTTVNAPVERVHALVDDLHSWQQWSPWEGLDANLQRTYSGADKGVGATYAWTGNKKAGQGTMKIVRSEEQNIDVDVTFVKPFKSTSTSHFTFTPSGEGTTVEWRMTGEQNALMSVIGKLWPMDKMMGPDFEKGLARLKAAAERA